MTYRNPTSLGATGVQALAVDVLAPEGYGEIIGGGQREGLKVIGARHDTMDPAHMEWMAGELPNGEYLFCPNGAHVAYYDDTEVYMDGLIRFLERVHGGG